MNYYLVHTTYPILFISVFARQLSIPVPAILFLLSAGALAGSGKLSYAGIMAVAVLGSVLADLVWFEAGRLQGKRVLRLLCALASDPSYCIRRARNAFARRGLRLLLIAKFVPGLDGVSPPLAGMSGSRRIDFIAYDAGGSALWAGLYVTCGFIFAKELDKVERYTSVVANIANVFLLVFGVPLLLFFIWKIFLLIRMIRKLNSSQITADALKERLDAGERVGVIDLLRFEDDPQDIGTIPGAVRLDPQDVRRKKRIVVPDDVDLVVYCRSKNSFVSARVSMAMRKHGVQRIYLLVGGLAAWKSYGFPLSSEVTEAEAELDRLGIEVTPPWKSWTGTASSDSQKTAAKHGRKPRHSPR